MIYLDRQADTGSAATVPRPGQKTEAFMGNVELKAAVAEIVEDAIRRLNVEKGHDLCTDDCECPLGVRMTEDHLLHARDELRKDE